MTQDLYTTKDVKEVREALIYEQEGLDALTGLPLNKPCLDHRHDSEQFVRGVLSNACNVALGKIESLDARYISYWYPNGLPEFLRHCADYLEQEKDTRYRHPGFLKKLQTRFNGLTEPQKKNVLEAMGLPQGTNGKERKEEFRLALLTKCWDFATITTILNRERG